MSAEVLSLFNANLSSTDSAVRTTAVQSLSAQLATSSTPEDVNYALRRLVRGLASPRESSRLGFSTALVQVLNVVESITLKYILDLLLSATQVTGSLKGSEEKELLVARLLGIFAIWQSTLVLRSSTDADQLDKLATASVSLSKQKAWIAQPAYQALLAGIKNLSSDSNRAKTIFPKIAVSILSTTEPWTPEQLGIALALQRLEPTAISWETLTSEKFKKAKIMSSKNLNAIAKIAKGADSSVENNSPLPQSALHFLWSELITSCVSQPPTKEDKGVSLVELFRVIGEGTLFSASSTQKQKQTGFSFFALCFENIESSERPKLLLTNFMRTWSNHLAGKDRHLNTDAKRLADLLPQYSSIDLLSSFSSSQFVDSPGFRKVLEAMVKSLQGKDEIDWAQKCVNHLLDDEADTKNSDKPFEKLDRSRRWYLDQLTMIVRKPTTEKSKSLPSTVDLADAIMNFFTVHGYFDVLVATNSPKDIFKASARPPNVVFSSEIKSYFRTKLAACLAHFASSQPAKISESAVKIGELYSNKAHFALAIDNNTEEIFAEQRKLQKAIKTCSENKNVKFHVLAHLGNAILLYSYAEPGTVDLFENFIDAVNALATSPTRKEKQTGEEGEAVNPTTLLLNFLIELFQHQVSFFRTLAQSAVKSFAGDISDQALLFLLDEITPDDVVNDEGDDEDGDEENENEDSEDSVDGEDEEDEEDEDEEEEDPKDEDYKKQLLQILESTGLAAKEDDEDSDNNEDEDVELNDEQMFELDEKLSSLFRERKEAKLASKNLQTQTIHARQKVLDLVEVLSKTRQPFSSTLIMLQSLFTCASHPLNRKEEIGKKATRILQSIISSKPVPSDITEKERTELLSLFKQVHQVASNLNEADIASLCESLSIYLCTPLIAEVPSKIQECYQTTLEQHLNRSSSRLPPSFFIAFFKKHCKHCEIFVPSLLNTLDISSTIKSRKRLDSIHIIDALLRNYASMAKKQGDQSVKEVESIIDGVASKMLKLLEAIASTESTQPPLKRKRSKSAEEYTSIPAHDFLNAAALKELIKLALQAVRISLDVLKRSPDVISDTWQADSLKLQLERITSSNEIIKGASSSASISKQLITVIQNASSQNLQQQSKQQKNRREKKKEKKDEEIVKTMANGDDGKMEDVIEEKETKSTMTNKSAADNEGKTQNSKKKHDLDQDNQHQGKKDRKRQKK